MDEGVSGVEVMPCQREFGSYTTYPAEIAGQARRGGGAIRRARILTIKKPSDGGFFSQQPVKRRGLEQGGGEIVQLLIERALEVLDAVDDVVMHHLVALDTDTAATLAGQQLLDGEGAHAAGHDAIARGR